MPWRKVCFILTGSRKHYLFCFVLIKNLLLGMWKDFFQAINTIPALNFYISQVFLDLQLRNPGWKTACTYNGSKKVFQVNMPASRTAWSASVIMLFTSSLQHTVILIMWPDLAGLVLHYHLVWHLCTHFSQKIQTPSPAICYIYRPPASSKTWSVILCFT